MNLKEHIQNKEETIEINKQELKILRQMEKITNSIFELQELVIDYEEWGYDVNNIKPFLENYPFKYSLFDYKSHNQWGDKETNKE
tara:strand:+ start:777 stop:1031 length:255 start_codon:yes stop_codon:yes gene_type:complete